MTFFVLVSALIAFNFSMADEPEVIEFVIPAGTGELAWNTKDDPIVAPMGSIIRFTNHDEVVHRLHTNGSPCGHGPEIQPEESWDCEVEYDFSSIEMGPLWDHNFGRGAQVWIEIE